MAMEIAWLKKSGFELSNWPSTNICTCSHSWILSTLAEILDQIGSGCVDWKHLIPHRVQLQALVNRIMNFWLHTKCKISQPAGWKRTSQERLCSKQLVSEDAVRCFKYWKNTYFYCVQNCLLQRYTCVCVCCVFTPYISIKECLQKNDIAISTLIFEASTTYAPGPSQVHVTVSSLLG